MEINKCKRKALHTVLLKENLHLHNSKPLVSAKQMKFQAETQVAVFLSCFFGWVTKKSRNDHVKWKCWLIQNRSFWCFCLSCLQVPVSPHLTKKLGDQCEFLLCSGMLAMLKGQQPMTGRQGGQAHRLSPFYVTLQIGVNFFMQLPLCLFQELPPSSTSQEVLAKPLVHSSAPIPRWLQFRRSLLCASRASRILPSWFETVPTSVVEITPFLNFNSSPPPPHTQVHTHIVRRKKKAGKHGVLPLRFTRISMQPSERATRGKSRALF